MKKQISELPGLVDPGEIQRYKMSCGEFHKRYRAELAPVIRQYLTQTKAASESMQENLVVKFMFWADRILGELPATHEEAAQITVQYTGKPKKQELLFYEFLKQFGIKVQYCESLPAQQSRDRERLQSGQQDREWSFEELAQLAASVVMIAVHGRDGEVLGTGSGIMISSKGYILTNCHVAAGGAFYSVRIEEDDQVYQTDELIKYHPVLDLAILRIDRTLQPLTIYRGGKELVRGQKVVAIGSPMGLFNSVSDGIISGFRNIDNVDMIQFTAPTSRGSSGGALLNLYGQVIGISTAGFDKGQNLNLAMGYQCILDFAGNFLEKSS